MPSCPDPGRPVVSSALRASGTNRWTSGTSVITRRYSAVITENPPVNSALDFLITMKKRLRKKKHVGEFAVFGIPVSIRLVDGKDFDSFLDAFLEHAIEANGCYFGGCGQKDRLSGILELGRKADLLEERLKKISYWLDTKSDVANYLMGEIDDLWYSSFDDLDTIAEKI